MAEPLAAGQMASCRAGAARRYLEAVARLLDIDPRLRIDLVAVEEAPAALRATIQTGGLEL